MKHERSGSNTPAPRAFLREGTSKFLQGTAKLRRRDADDAAEDLGESTRAGVADFERDLDQAALGWESPASPFGCLTARIICWARVMSSSGVAGTRKLSTTRGKRQSHRARSIAARRYRIGRDLAVEVAVKGSGGGAVRGLHGLE